LWGDVAQAIKYATGTSFNRDKVDDALRPKRSAFYPRTVHWMELDKAAEKAGQQIDKATEKAGDKLEKAGKKIKDSVK
jgi:hypothetical protein